MIFDLCVVGAGPAGLSCAVSAASEGLKTVVLEASPCVGGQARYSAAIENYLGFPRGVTGQQLANRAGKQVRKFGGEVRVNSRVVGLERIGELKLIELETGPDVRARALVVACGLQWRSLSLGKEVECRVIYGGDKNRARWHRGEEILIVGGGNSAGQAALHWSRFGSVTLSAKYPLEDTMSSYLIERIKGKGIRVEIESKLEGVRGKRCDLTQKTVPCDVVIPFVGAVPQGDFARDLCECDGEGYLKGGKCEGVWVVGDCREGSVKRVAVAVGEGTAVVPQVHKYLGGLK